MHTSNNCYERIYIPLFACDVQSAFFSVAFKFEFISPSLELNLFCIFWNAAVERYHKEGSERVEDEGDQMHFC